MTVDETAVYLYETLMCKCVHEVKLDTHCEACARSRTAKGTNERRMLSREAALDVIGLQCSAADKE